MRRLFLQVLLPLGLTIFGFVLGAVLAAQFVVPPSAGLEGSATVAIFVMGGALVGLVAGILLAARLAPSTRAWASVAALFLAVASIGLLAWRAAEERELRKAVARAAAPVLGPDGRPLPPPLPPPGTANKLLGLITVPPELLPRYETREHDYEVKSIAVYGQEGNWFLAGLPDGGREWLHTRATGRYFRLEDLIVNRLNWLTEAWDSRLRDVPDPTAPAREVPLPSGRGREVPATILEARRDEAAGTLWLRVEVLAHSPCDGGTPPVVARGWIPAWGESGQPTAWFYSRGC